MYQFVPCRLSADTLLIAYIAASNRFHKHTPHNIVRQSDTSGHNQEEHPIMSSQEYEYQCICHHKNHHDQSQKPFTDGDQYDDSKAALLVVGGGLLARQSFHQLKKVIYNSQGLWKDVRHILTFVIRTNARVRSNGTGTTSTSKTNTNCSTSSNSKSGGGVIYSESFNYFTMNDIHAEDQIDLIRHILWKHHHNDQHDPTPRDILPMLLQSLDISSVLPILDMHMKSGSNSSGGDSTTIAATTNSISMSCFYNCQGASLFTELGMDSNHVGLNQLLDALQKVLLQLQPQLQSSSIQEMNIAAIVIATEARNIDYVPVDYMEQFYLQSDEAEVTAGAERTRKTTFVEEFHLFHTPMQAAWESTLYHRDEYMVLDSIQNDNDFLLLPPLLSSSQQKYDI